MSEHGNDESVVRDRLSVLSRQKWILLAAVIVVPLLAFAASRGQQRLYQASVNVLVNEQNPTAAALNLQTGVASPPDRYAATQATLARGEPVAQMAVTAANVPHRTAAALLANSAVSADLNADVLTFLVTDHVPIVAEKLANAYATQFTVYRHRLDTAALSAAIADVSQKLNAIVASGGKGSLLYTRLAIQASDLEALQTLQAAGSSAVVVDPASGASLVQPKTRRNVLLGVIVGLALGIALAFFRESLDTRVHSADELRARLGLPLLGQIPKPGRRARAEPLATLSDPTGSSNEAYRILKTNLEISQLQHNARSVVITSTTRGEGTSAAAANLAVILARSGRHVILVDLDLRHPSIDRFFGLGDRPGLTSVAGGVELVDALSRVDVRRDPTTAAAGMLEVLTVGPPPADPGEFLSSSFLPEALAALAVRCDVLLIDTPPVLAVGDAITVATRTDAMILVVAVDQVRRGPLAEAHRVLEACPTRKLGFIATGIKTTGSGTRRQGVRSALTGALTQYARQVRPGIGIAALLEGVRPTLAGGDAVARELEAPHFGTLSLDAGAESGALNGAATVTYQLNDAARRAGVTTVELLGASSTVHLALFAEWLEMEVAASGGDTPSLAGAPRSGNRSNPRLSIRPFGPQDVAESKDTGLLVITPSVLKKSDLVSVAQFVRSTPWPLLGVITYKPTQHWWTGLHRERQTDEKEAEVASQT